MVTFLPQAVARNPVNTTPTQLARIGEVVGQGIDAFGERRREERERSRLAEIGEIVQGGDLNAAAAMAFQAGQPQIGLNLIAQQQQAQQRQQITPFQQAQLDLRRQQLSQTANRPQRRQTAKDAQGRQRFVDSGELVFPNVQDTRAEQRQQQRQQAGEVVTADIDRAISIAEESPMTTTGLGGQLLSNVGGTQARDLEALTETIKANTGFDRLQAMREASPTGGALGQVSNMELRQLNSAIGNLDQSQSQAQFIDNLRRVKNIYLDIIHGPGQGPDRERLAFEQQQQTQQSSQAANPTMSRADALASDVQGVPQTATNPQTGERVQWNPQTQAWEPM